MRARNKAAPPKRVKRTDNLVLVFVGMLLLVLLMVSGYREFMRQDTRITAYAVHAMQDNPVKDYITIVKEQQDEIMGKAMPVNSSAAKPFRSTGNLTVHFLDVGHGDSIIIVTPTLGIVLIDGGFEDQPRYILNYMKGLGVNYLDYAIASHPDADHIGGLDMVIDKMAYVNEVLDNGKAPYNASDNDMRSYRSYRKVSLDQEGYKPVRKDMTLKIDDNIRLQVLVPFDNKTYFNDTNDNSLIVKLTYGDVSFLFTGDCARACEERLLKKDIKADILKVPHHGDDDSMSQEFLDAVRPEMAVISTGDYERFGHPHAAVLKRLEDAGAKVYRTDLDGNVIVTTDGSSYTVSTVSREEASKKHADAWARNATNSTG